MKNWLLNKILIRMLNKLPPNVLKTLEWGSELVNNAIDSINRRKKNTPKKHFKRGLYTGVTISLQPIFARGIMESQLEGMDMAQKAPDKSGRKGISLVQITNMFPNDEAAEKWITEQRWPDGPYCPHCGSLNVQSGIKHSSMTHRCRLHG